MAGSPGRAMRVVYLNPCGQMGGAETSLREMLAAVRTAEPQSELWLVLGEDGPLARIAWELGVRVEVEPFPDSLARLGDAGDGSAATAGALARAIASCARYQRKLAGLLRRIQPDLIHSNGLKMHVIGCWSAPAKTALVWHIHDYVSSRRTMRQLLSWHSRRCTMAIANSADVARDLESLMPRLPVRRVYNAVDLARFSPEGSRMDLDSAAGLPPAPAGTVRVGLVGTFAQWKGHKVFLEAASRVSTETPVRAYVIGGPIYQTRGSQWTMEELREEAARLGVSGRVGFTGFVSDTPAAMRALDIIVHASTKPEPFGMVIIEGMACGKAVIASQSGGAAELFVDGKNALGHVPGDAAALARQIARLVSDKGLRRRLGECGRQTAERLFNRERLTEELLAVYTEAHGERGARQPAASTEPALEG